MIQYNNFLMKREQSRAGSRFAECEKSRLKAKILITLALLLTAVTGAWADETPLVTITFGYSGPVYSESGIVTVTGSNADSDYNGGKYSWSPTGTISLMSVTVEPAAGYNITKVVFWSNDNGNYANALEDTAEPYVCYSKFSSEGKSLSDDLSNKVDGYNIAKIEVYGYLAEPPITVEPVEGKTNEWTFSMPGSDVLVDVEYKDLTAMALTFGGKAIPEAGLKGFLGFEQEFIDGLNLDAAVTNTDQNGAAVTTDATSYTYTSSDATVIGFKTATEGVYAQSGALADMEFRQEGSATLTIQYAGTEDLGKSAETVLLVTVSEKTYTVELADNTADADNWQGKIGDNGTYAALPVEGLKGSEKVVLKYDGSRIVKRVTATVEGAAPAGPKTYTELKGGEVLHVGDILDFSDANVEYLFSGCALNQNYCPYTVLRANITGDHFDPTITPADDGAYYVIRGKNGGYAFTDKTLPATATSDGILITINSENGNYRYCSASVHEP